MKTLTGTKGPDRLSGSGNESFTLVGSSGNDTYTFRLDDYTTRPDPVGGITFPAVVHYYRDAVVETANGGIDTANLIATYNPVEFTGIYPAATVSAKELANIENVFLASAGSSIWNVSTDDHANSVHGSARGDKISSNAGDDRIYGGGGDDLIDGGRGLDWLYGEAGNDRLTDLSGNNRFAGGPGNDLITAGAGADLLFGGTENDELNAGAGADQLFGEAGNDMLAGGAGADRLDGGPGLDAASYDIAPKGVTVNLSKPALNTGDAKGDTYVSIEGVSGSAFADSLTGSAKTDFLFGANGNDTLRGGDGNDELRGGIGKDRLDGGAGNDKLFVTSRSDADDLTGGAGRDVFDFTVDKYRDGLLAVIRDFQDGADVIHISGVKSFKVEAEQVGHDVLLSIVDTSSLTSIFIRSVLGTITLLSTDVDDITGIDLAGATVVHDGTF